MDRIERTEVVSTEDAMITDHAGLLVRLEPAHRIAMRMFDEFGVWPAQLLCSFVLPGLMFIAVCAPFQKDLRTLLLFCSDFFFPAGFAGFLGGLTCFLYWNFCTRFKIPFGVKLSLALWGAIATGLVELVPLVSIGVTTWPLGSLLILLPSFTGGLAVLLPLYYRFVIKKKLSMKDSAGVSGSIQLLE